MRSFTTGKSILTTRVSRMLHMFQVRYVNTRSYTQTNKNHTVPSDVWFFCFFFEADFHSSDSSDDDVPCLTGRSLHQEYGRNAAASI